MSITEYDENGIEHWVKDDLHVYENLGSEPDEDYEPEDEEWEEERSPEPWEEQVRLWGMYPNE